ncbi:DUF2953 domain-containing protein [Natranaerobius trueperi]|uniref:DUF2953 domain-containing protein n=1 Tax=Natranaerobius trueperi TaxID=759412 RepID=A0A226BYG6_9FIRM|nr:DUF2953 domain-containing protein [Natranaerobius trueperi]OWZ83971.1 hypothetical protein CDO51_05260 [Natranaerobius trueperi]
MGLKKFVFVIPLFYIFMLVSPIVVTVSARKAQKDEDISLVIGLLWNLISFKVKIPYLIFNQSNLKTETDLQTKKGLLGRLGLNINLKQRLSKSVCSKENLLQMVILLLKYITLHKLIIKAGVGVADAFYTAMLNGVGWTILGNMDHLLKHLKKTKNFYKDFAIVPYYDKLYLDTYFECTFHLHGYQITLIGLSLMINGLKRRLLKWKNIPSKA